MTWTAWKTLVAAAYRTTAPNAMGVYRAVAAYTKGQIIREVDRDIPLSRSYRDAYADLRLDLAGYAVTETHATIKTAVLRLLTVDAARPAIGNFLSDLVQQAMDELNAGVTLYDALVLEAAIHLQQQIDGLRGTHESYYKASDLGAQGAISQGLLPAGCSPQRMNFLRYAQALAEVAAYTAGEFVQSNQRIYEVVTGGTIGAGQLGAGLTSIDSTETETIDGVVFRYDGPVVDTPMLLVGWDRLRPLLQADPADDGAYVWAVDPVARAFFVHPQVDADHQLCLEWGGIKLSFAGTDEVPFGEQEARAAAEYVRSHLATKFGDSTQQAALADGRYKEALRRISADFLARQAGT